MTAQLATPLAALLAEPEVSNLLDAIEDSGAQARIVGGAVRNALIGQPLSDIDIATTALPGEILALARARGWKAVPTGLEHGTVTIILADRPFEVTTLREDIETNGRHAVVRFGTDFRVDAARRDFTINAMSLGCDGVLHDYFGGADDLVARRVRFIGDPLQRLREDFLRGLRFLRFSATYAGGALDEAGFSAVLAEKAGLDGLSRERVRQEMLKLLVAPRASAVLAEAERFSLVSRIIGVEVNLARFDYLVVRERGAGFAPSAIARLFALCGGDFARHALLRARLRLSNRESAQLAAMAGALDLAEGGASPRLLAYQFPDGAQTALLLGRGPLALLTPPVFLLKGEDILARGEKTGPLIGLTLAKAETAWIAAGFPESRSAQLAILDQVLAG